MLRSPNIADYLLPQAGTVIPALDGLRGIAIILVMLHHFAFYGRMQDGIFLDTLIRRVLLSGWIGVDLFFVLSGFLITGILLDSKSQTGYFRNFYARRFLRIFPLYYSVLFALFIVLPLLHTPGPKLASLFTQQGWYWTYMINVDIGFNGWPKNSSFAHFWSLAVEEQFYLFWPLVVFFVRQRSLVLTCGLLLLFSLAVRISLILLDLKTGAYVLTPARLDTLALGGLLAVVLRSEKGKAYAARWTFPVFITSGLALVGLFLWKGYLTTGAGSVLSWGLTMLALLFGASLVFALAAPEGSLLGKSLSSRTLRFFGRYSYALYIFHHPISIYLPPYLLRIDRFPTLLGSQLLGLVLFSIVATALSVALALLSWHLLESRFLALKRFFAYRTSEKERMPAI